MSDNQIRPLLQRKNAAVMGVVNVTPDSFSDGGKFSSLDAAVKHATRLVEQGADILDIGGESTRPGADKVSAQEEMDRVVPIIEKLATMTDAPISVDTHKTPVMKAAVSAGAQMINDVNGLRDKGAVKYAATAKVPVCIMHMQGEPKNMQADPKYQDVVEDVIDFFQQRIKACEDAGVNRGSIIVDPGIGFGKTLSQNLTLLKNSARIINATQCPLLIGVSRKSLIEAQLGRAVGERLPASLGLAVQAVMLGARLIRVHDVRETVDAVRMVEAVRDVV